MIAVGEGGIGVDVVDPDVDAVVLATVLLGDARAEEGVDDRSVGVKDDAHWIASGGRGHVGRLRNDAQLAGCSLVTVKPVPLTTRFAPLTSSLSAPLSVSVTPAVGTALHRAAAASTIALACWLVTVLFNGP